MTLQALSDCYLYDTVRKQWIVPNAGNKSTYMLYQHAIRVHDSVTRIKGVQDVSDVLYSINDKLDYYDAPRGYFTDCIKIGVDGERRTEYYYIFSGILHFDPRDPYQTDPVQHGDPKERKR